MSSHTTNDDFPLSLVLNEEQRLLKTTIRELIQRHAPVSVMRELRDAASVPAYSTELWRQLVQLGVPAMAMPEAYGGLGFGYLGLGAVMQEAGRTLAASPLLSTVVLGASALELAGTEQQREQFLPLIAAGELTLAFAMDEARHYQPLATSTQLVRDADGFVLRGGKVFVSDGCSADKLLVAARSAGEPGDSAGLSLVLVDRAATGVGIEHRRLMDGRDTASVSFEQVRLAPDAILGAPGQAWPVLETMLDRAATCLSAEMLGGALALFDITLDYLRERRQFGVHIGSFQALQHRCAQMFCQLEKCRSVVADALAGIDRGDREQSLQASTAKAVANECFRLVSNEAVQMHGGMGVTDELDVGLYLKRARVCIQAFGDTAYHQDRFARLSGY